jgi:hypothetical protein
MIYGFCISKILLINYGGQGDYPSGIICFFWLKYVSLTITRRKKPIQYNNRSSTDEMKTIEQIPELVRALCRTVAELQRLFPERPFTPDGHLVGSLGEVIAAHDYNLRLLPPSTEGYDALTADGRRVEIKITQGTRVALRNSPDHLLVLKLRADGTAEEVYNGPGGEPWSQSGRMQKNGQRPISLSKLKGLMKTVCEENKIKKTLEQDAPPDRR